MAFLLLSSVGRSEERGTLARYIVFEVDASGVVKPQMHRIVNLAAPLSSLTEAQVVAGLSEPSPEGDRVAVQLLDSFRSVLHRDIVEIPRWMRTEIGADGFLDESRGEPLVPLSTRSFVVRVPVVPASRLALSFARSENAGPGMPPQDAEFDLTALAADATLPLARFSPIQELRAAEAGTSANRVDVLIMGDGYTTAQASKFASDAAALSGAFFSIAPYSTYRNFVKISTLFTASTDSGADHPPYSASCAPASSPPILCCADTLMQSDPLRGTFVSTAFDASFCTSNIHRLLTVNTTKVLAAAAAAPDWDKILVAVNDSTYGGSGGSLAVSSTHSQAVGIVQHEYGHSFTRLADEYVTPFPGFAACSDVHGPSCEANVTDQSNRTLIKWSPWIRPETPVPTPGNATYASAVGLFEGARFLSTGMYRPRLDCIMRTLGQPFCEICTQAYILRLYRGGWGVPASGIDNIEPGSETPAPGAVTMTFPGSKTFSVSLLQPTDGPALTVTWLVNGTAVLGATSSSFTFTPSAPGSYRIELRTHDGTPLVDPASAGTALDHSRVWNVTASQSGCVPSSTTLCLNNGRFRVQATWTTPDGQTGGGQANALTSDTGEFWFFTDTNIEMVVKVVDGRGFNGRFWVFAAGLTNVQVVITITDTQTGNVKTYSNPQGTAFLPIQDTSAFAGSTSVGIDGVGGQGSTGVHTPVSDSPVAGSAGGRDPKWPGAACAADATTLCLNRGRFSIRTQWTTPDGKSGAGQAFALTADTGYFWFFSAGNVEIIVKELDACGFNSRFWTFAGGLTNVAVMMTVTDTQTGQSKTYTNSQGTAFAPIQDTSAFATCP